MSKKHKKIFKQKIRQMLSEMEKPTDSPAQQKETPQVQPVITPVTPQEDFKPTPEVPVVKSQPKTPVLSSASNQSIAPVKIVKTDLKKIALLFSVMILVVIAAFLISTKTNWLFNLADKIYNWAQLGL